MDKKQPRTGVKKETVQKPFLTGNATDENTVRSSFGFFGILLIIIVVSFIVCATAVMDNKILRIGLNAAVIAATLMIVYNRGAVQGAEAVARGEILYQKKEKGQSFSEAERKICFHPLKGYLNGLFGTLPFLIAALVLASVTTVQMTQAGTLPSWMQAYLRRSDIGNALVNYTQPDPMGLADYVRAAVRICIIPYVNIVSYTNKYGMMVLERLSPLIMLIPAAVYGTGYLRGKKIRTGIHTAIKENDRNRIRREKRKMKARMNASRKNEPEQLN